MNLKQDIFQPTRSKKIKLDFIFASQLSPWFYRKQPGLTEILCFKGSVHQFENTQNIQIFSIFS